MGGCAASRPASTCDRELAVVDRLHRAFRDAPGLRFLALDLSQLEEVVALARIRDRFDRLIVSADRELCASLLTRDSKLEEAGLVETIW